MSLLGGIDIRTGAGRRIAIPTRKAQALLAYLAVPAGRRHPRAELVATFWDGLEPGAARNNLRQTLFELRRRLPSGLRPALSTDRESVCPPRVRSLTEQRIDSLAEIPRRLVVMAAVIGRPFDFGLLAGATALDEGSVAEAVEDLVTRRLLHAAGERLDFTHERVREITLDRTSAPRLRILHARVASAIESHYARDLGAHHGELAHHFRAGEIWDKAVRYLALVAAAAAARYAHADAVDVLREALGLVPRLSGTTAEPARLDLTLAMARSLYFLGRFQEIATSLERETATVADLDDPARAGSLHCWLGIASTNLGAQRRAASAAGRAIVEARRARDRATEGRAHYILAQVAIFNGHPRAGAKQAHRAIHLLAAAGERWWLGHAHWALAACHCYTGRFREALAEAERGREIGEEIADPRLTSYSAHMAAWARACLGDGAAALAAGRYAVEQAPDPLSRAAATAHLGLALLEGGDGRAAGPLLGAATERFREFGLRQLQSRCLAWLGEAHLSLGERAQADVCARAALTVARSVGYDYAAALAERLLGRIALETGEIEQADDHLSRARAAGVGRRAVRGCPDPPRPRSGRPSGGSDRARGGGDRRGPG